MTDRRGIALAAALAAMVIIAVLVTGVLFAAGQETRSTRHGILEQQAFAYAELAASRAIASMNPETIANDSTGAVSVFTSSRDGLLESTVLITKLDSALASVVAEGRVAGADASRLRRRVEIVVRFARDSTGTNRALRIPSIAWSALY